MTSNKFLGFAKKPVTIGLVMFVLLLALTQLLAYQRYLLLKENELRKLNNEAVAAKDRLQATLNGSLSSTQTLAFVVEKYGIPHDFDSVGKALLQSNKLIDLIQLVEGGVITHVYPLKGNEVVIGYDILKDSVRNKGAFIAMRTGEFFFAGPTNLKQGGIGVIGRQPIFINGKFWGFSAVVIRLPNLLKAAGIDSIGNRDFTYQLSRINPESRSEEFFLPDHKNYTEENSVPIEIPNSEWKLYVMSNGNSPLVFVLTFSLMGLILSITGGSFAYFMANQPLALHKLVEEKTAEIAASEEKYRTLVEHAGDAIFLVNPDTTFIDVNTSACKLLGYTREEFLRMRITDLYSVGELEKKPLQWDLLRKNKSVMSERRLKRKNGSEVDVEINSKLQEGKGFLAIVRDITERIKAEQEVMKAYKDKETVLNRISDAVVSVDNEWRYTFLNDAAMATHPEGKEQIIGKNIWDVHPEMKGTILWDKYHEAMETRKVVEVETYYEPLNFWAYVKVYPSADGLTFFYEDITESKRHEQEVLREKNLSASIINSLPGAFYLYDQNGKFIRWNKNFETISGYTAEEVSNMHPLDFFDADEKELLSKKINEVFKNGTAEVEAPFLTKDRRKIPYFFNGNLANLDGKDYLIGMGIDITEREKAEREIVLEKNLSESIINSMPGIFYLADFNGRLLRWNKNFETVSGYTTDELSTMRVIQFVAMDEQQELLMKKQMAIQHGMSDIEANFLTKQKQKLPYYFTSLLTQYKDQPCLVGVGIDITERKKAEEKILGMNEELRNLSAHLQNIREEERTSIAREIHDELGQQLTGLKMDASWIRKSINDITTQEKLTDMIALIDETIKTVRRISSDLRPGILDDLGLLAALEWQSNEFEKRTGIKCRFTSTVGEPSVAKNVATGIFRVYQETLTNVARHAQASSVETKIYEENGHLTLIIADNGKGFDIDEVKNKNTLGLVGMKERAHMFNGELIIESKKQKGTTIVIKVPFLQSKA